MPLRGKQASGLLTQQKMLRAAVKLFLEKGYEGTTTAEIARAAGMTPSSFFRAFPSKEALLLELDKRMFSGQFALAEQHSTARDPVLLYAVETAIQLHIAELTEPLRELYVTAYTLPSTSAYLYRSTAKRLEGIFGGLSFGRGGQGFLRDGDRLGGHDALVHGCAVRRVFYRGAQDRALFGVRAQALQCAGRAAAGGHRSRFAARPARHGGGHHPNDRPAGGKGL